MDSALPNAQHEPQPAWSRTSEKEGHLAASGCFRQSNSAGKAAIVAASVAESSADIRRGPRDAREERGRGRR